MRDFALEVFFSKWEFAAKYNLAGSDGGIVMMWCSMMNWRIESSVSCVVCSSRPAGG